MEPTPKKRQQLIQEFFFHLVGATEILAQIVNEVRSLGLHAEDVKVPVVVVKLAASDPATVLLRSLYARTQKKPLMVDSYSDEGYVFRILDYRHQVTHRRRNPFLFRVGSTPQVSLWIDPRDQSIGPSLKSAQEELEYMFQFVNTRCEDILALL